MKTKIEDIVKKGEYVSYGLVTRDQLYSVGDDNLPESFDWDYENDCPSEETIGGVCCTSIRNTFDDEIGENIDRAFDVQKNYRCQYQYLVGTNDGSRYGNDDEEVILKNPVILLVIQ